MTVVGQRETSPQEVTRHTETTERSCRVLVIDDEKRILEVMPKMLEPLHTVVVAPGGREALEILAHDRKFDVVLCDLIMPRMTGMELFEKVEKECPELAKRFVFITGGAITPKVDEFVGRVSNPTIKKPMATGKLLNLINSIVQDSVPAMGLTK